MINHRLFLILVLFGLLVSGNIAQDDDPASVPTWDGDSRFTVLIAGMDRRPEARDTLSVRTDAILLLSVDPQNERIGILHIPRDLHFVPPNEEEFVRVNSLLVFGEQIDDGYGPGYMLGTLQYNLGMYIDRYLLVDFEAFITLVDAIGGVNISIDYVINDPTYPDMNYGYDPFYLNAGEHTLDGYDALRFARTRHGDNDFLRGERQLQVISALQTRLTEAETLPRLLAQAPDLLDTLEDNIYTDLTLDEMIALATYGLALETDALITGAMRGDYIMTFTQPGGSTIYVPARSELVELLTSVFGEGYTGQ